MKYIGREKHLKRFAKLVFQNSYLETSEGIFLLGTCLPMGLNCSGEAMDLVLLIAELIFLGKIASLNISMKNISMLKRKADPFSSAINCIEMTHFQL